MTLPPQCVGRLVGFSSDRGAFGGPSARRGTGTLLDLRGSIPAFIHISDEKLHDVKVLGLLIIEAGTFYIMDLLDFERLGTSPNL